MKCEKCKAEFTLKEQAKAKGCCPSCGVKLPASAYRDDAKAWRWYQFHSPMPLSVILAYVYLYGGGGLALMIVLADWEMLTVTDLAGWLSVIGAALVFLLPFFALFFMPSARRWRAKCREDAVVYNVAVKSGKLSLRKYQIVMSMIFLAVALGVLWCLWQTAPAYRNQNGQQKGTMTEVGHGLGGDR